MQVDKRIGFIVQWLVCDQGPTKTYAIMNKPKFRSFDEFSDHIKGREWKYIKTLFHHEYEATSYVADLPLKKRLADPMTEYEHTLGVLLTYLRGGVMPLTFHERKNEPLRKKLELIRADLESRKLWPLLDAL